MAYRNTALRFFVRSTQEWGENPQRTNGTVRCMFFPTAQQRGHSRERGRLCGKNGRKSAHQVRIFGSGFLFGFPKRNICECINAFAPKSQKGLWCFFVAKIRERGAFAYGADNSGFGCLLYVKMLKRREKHEENFISASCSHYGYRALPNNCICGAERAACS